MSYYEVIDLPHGYFGRVRSDGKIAVCRPPFEDESRDDVAPICVEADEEAAAARAERDART